MVRSFLHRELLAVATCFLLFLSTTTARSDGMFGRGGSIKPVSIRRPASTIRHPNSSQSQTPSAQSLRNEKEQEKIAAREAMQAFLTRDSRNTFIARVYAILAGQLLVTAGSIVYFGTHPNIVNWMHRPGFGQAVPILSLILSTIAFVIMSMSTNARRNPVKWQILALFTVGEAMSVGFLSSFYQFRSVVSAMLTTAAAATGVSLYTVCQKSIHYDLSQWGASLSSFGLIFAIYGTIQVLSMLGVLPKGFMPYSEMVYGLIGATLFSFYLAYHTRLIVAGKHSKYQMNEKDYVFGAMTLYNDIINLFVYLLKAIGEDKDH